MKLYLDTFVSVRRDCRKKADDFIKKSLIVAHIFIDILEIRGFFSNSIMNNLKSAYQIYILEVLL